MAHGEVLRRQARAKVAVAVIGPIPGKNYKPPGCLILTGKPCNHLLSRETCPWCWPSSTVIISNIIRAGYGSGAFYLPPQADFPTRSHGGPLSPSVRFAGRGAIASKPMEQIAWRSTSLFQFYVAHPIEGLSLRRKVIKRQCVKKSRLGRVTIITPIIPPSGPCRPK